MPTPRELPQSIRDFLTTRALPTQAQSRRRFPAIPFHFLASGAALAEIASAFNPTPGTLDENPQAFRTTDFLAEPSTAMAQTSAMDSGRKNIFLCKQNPRSL